MPLVHCSTLCNIAIYFSNACHSGHRDPQGYLLHKTLVREEVLTFHPLIVRDCAKPTSILSELSDVWTWSGFLKQLCFKSHLMRHQFVPTIANLVSHYAAEFRLKSCSRKSWNPCRFMPLELCRFQVQLVRKVLVEKKQFQQSLQFPCAEVFEYRFANATFRSQNDLLDVTLPNWPSALDGHGEADYTRCMRLMMIYAVSLMCLYVFIPNL